MVQVIVSYFYFSLLLKAYMKLLPSYLSQFRPDCAQLTLKHSKRRKICNRHGRRKHLRSTTSCVNIETKTSYFCHLNALLVACQTAAANGSQ